MNKSGAYIDNVIKYLDNYCKSKERKYQSQLSSLKALIIQRKSTREIFNFAKSNEIVLFPSSSSQKSLKISEIANKNEAELDQIIQKNLRYYKQALKDVRTEITNKILSRARKNQNGPYTDLVFSHISKICDSGIVFHVVEHRGAANHVGQKDDQFKVIIIYDLCNMVLS